MTKIVQKRLTTLPPPTRQPLSGPARQGQTTRPQCPPTPDQADRLDRSRTSAPRARQRATSVQPSPARACGISVGAGQKSVALTGATLNAIRVSPTVVDRTRTQLQAGDLLGAWSTLERSGDAFARYAGSIVSERGDPKTVFPQVVDAHWERITGEGIGGAQYQKVASEFLGRYLDYVENNAGSLPTTEVIERLDRATVDANGLPLLLATGSYQSKVSLETGIAFSWGASAGMPPSRTVYDSEIFADADFIGALETMKTATAAVVKYGINKPLTIDGAVATWKGAGDPGSALRVTPAVLARAEELAAQGDAAGAWHELSRHGDGYATGAEIIVAQRHDPSHFLAQVVDAHWDRVVGPEVKEQKFMQVGHHHLNNYLAYIRENDGNLPDTKFIEASYLDAVTSAGLPPLTAIDAIMSKMDKQMEDSMLGKIGLDDFSWSSVMGLPDERVIYDSDVFDHLDFDPGAEMAKTMWAAIKKHHVTLIGWDSTAAGARALWNLVFAGNE